MEIYGFKVICYDVNGDEHSFDGRIPESLLVGLNEIIEEEFVSKPEPIFRGVIKPKEKLITNQKFLYTEDFKIPADFKYDGLTNLSMEARQKLSKIRPVNLSQASRISGVSPSDISVMLVYLNR